MDPSASLAGQVFCLSGTFSSPKAALESRIRQLGGEVAKSLTKKVTALLVADPSNPAGKLVEAQARGVHLLDEGFLDQCEALAAGSAAAGKKGKGKKAEAKAAKPAAAAAEEKKPAAKATAKGKGASKKKQPEPEPEEEEEEQPPPAEEKPAAKGNGKGKKAAAAPAPAPSPAEAKAPAKGKGKGKKAVVVEEPDEYDEEEDDEPAPAAAAGSSGTTLDGAGFFGSAPKVQAWKNDAPGQPYFPAQYNVLKNVVLQNTNILNNNNKYYALELHEAEGKYFRLFTHYGRTDDLQSRGPMAGQRESRYYSSLAHAQAAFGQIYREKTSARKGYREVSLASSDIGSDRARGKSAGEIGASTLAKSKRAAEEEEEEKKQETATTKKARANKRSKKGEQDEDAKQSAAESKQQEDDIVLDVHVRELIQYIYEEAKTKLTSSINAEVTAEGIRTPLGILSIEQVEQGEAILDRIQQEVMRPSPRSHVLQQLSSEFYSAIPHKLGRTKADLQAAVIREESTVKEKQELLQLMKDMLEVNSNAKTNVIFHDNTVSRYRALQAEITWLAPETEEHQKVAARVVESVHLSHKRQVVLRNVFKVVRPNEQERFRHDIGNVQLLFHGSRLSNWVGLLSRGILMPKVVVAEGGRRTDAGWLGNGIYFGHADVANNYAAPGRKGTSLMFCNSVAIGRTKDFNAITYGMNAPPKGFDSCHGVMGTQFADHEYCVYDDAQQKVEYLLEVNRASYGYF